MNKNFYLVLCCLILSFCTTNRIYAQNLSQNVAFCKADTITIRQDTSTVILAVYQPVNCNISLTAKRPDSADNNIFFCVPAAFTAKNYKDIVGKFVSVDTIITGNTEYETGLCLIADDKITISHIADSDYYFSLAKNNNNVCYFQQMLLIKNHQPITCSVFKKQKPTFRRALAVRNGGTVVIESLTRMNIEDFTLALLSVGCKNAVYLDMGTWSEGFFKDFSGKISSVGTLRQNTCNQTNWLIFKN